MWQIIKAELSYNWLYLVFVYLFTVGIWVAYLFDAAGMIFLLGGPAFFLLLALFTRAQKEKRERLHGILPIAIKLRGRAGLWLYAVIFNIMTLSGWSTQFLREHAALANEFITFSGVLTLNGLTLSIVGLLGLYFDLQHHPHRKYRRLLAPLLGSVIPLYFAFKIAYQQNREIYDRAHDLVLYSPLAAVIVAMVCIGILYFSLTVYTGRKSYLV